MHCPYCCFANFRAEAETKAKLEKVAEIKRINAQIMAIKSEISKYEDTLKEYQLYKRFLFSVTPKVVVIYCFSFISTRCNIYISRLCYDVSVRLSVRDGSALADYS